MYGGTSAWAEQRGGAVAAPGGSGGASIFDPTLCELVYSWFSPPGGLVLDPFAGGSVRGIVASRLGRRYLGIELRPEQIAANEEQARAICRPSDPNPEWILGDARDSAELTAGRHADLVFSCPPYGDLEVYSDDPRDLSTLPWERFAPAYRACVAGAISALKPDRFACFVVGDFRAKSNGGSYRGFPEYTAAAMAAAGAAKYNEMILVTPCGSLPIRVASQFPASRKIGKTHQNVLVGVKGDARKAVEACGPVDISMDAWAQAEGDGDADEG